MKYMVVKEIYKTIQLISTKVHEIGQINDERLFGVLITKTDNDELKFRTRDLMNLICDKCSEIVNYEFDEAEMQSFHVLIMSNLTSFWNALDTYQEGTKYHISAVLNDAHPTPKQDLQIAKAGAWGAVNENLSHLRDLSLWFCHYTKIQE